MFQWMMTFLGSLAAIIVADVIRRWRPFKRWWPFKWWLALGYWFNAQAWGGGDDTLPFVEPSCWGRVLPAPVCRVFASFFLLKVEAPPESEGIEEHLNHREREWFKVLESWKRITARHQRRALHPRYCSNPTNRRWCSQPNCHDVAAGRVISDRARYYCKAHDPWADSAEEMAA